MALHIQRIETGFFEVAELDGEYCNLKRISDGLETRIHLPLVAVRNQKIEKGHTLDIALPQYEGSGLLVHHRANWKKLDFWILDSKRITYSDAHPQARATANTLQLVQ